jgi:hypothetical protein
MSRLVNAQFNVKISELNLLRISGQLVKWAIFSQLKK